MLREAVSNVEQYDFEIEDQLEKQIGTIPLPFPEMDSKPVSACAISLPFYHMFLAQVISCAL
jgi:hypothetical protein